jgi:hypothetical protein
LCDELTLHTARNTENSRHRRTDLLNVRLLTGDFFISLYPMEGSPDVFSMCMYEPGTTHLTMYTVPKKRVDPVPYLAKYRRVTVLLRYCYGIIVRIPI